MKQLISDVSGHDRVSQLLHPVFIFNYQLVTGILLPMLLLLLGFLYSSSSFQSLLKGTDWQFWSMYFTGF